MVDLSTLYPAFMSAFEKDPLKVIGLIATGVGLFSGAFWTVLTFFHKTLSDREQQRFDRYRLLIQELNTGRGSDGVFIDYQLDAIYELRFHKKYYPRTLWMLNRLRSNWEQWDNGQENKKYNKGHLSELDETINYISRRKNLICRVVLYVISFFWIFHSDGYSRKKYINSCNKHG